MYHHYVGVMVSVSGIMLLFGLLVIYCIEILNKIKIIKQKQTHLNIILGKIFKLLSFTIIVCHVLTESMQ